MRAVIMKHDLEFLLEDTSIVEELQTLQHLTTIGEFFEQAGRLAGTLYFSDNANLQTLRKQLENGLDEEKIKHVILYQNYSGTDPLSQQHDQLLRICSLKEQITRMIMKNMIEDGTYAFALSDVEKIVLLFSLDAMTLYDALYRKWHDSVVVSPLAQTLKDAGADNAKSLLIEQGTLTPEQTTQYLYIVFEQDENGKIIAKSYKEAFPEEVDTIIDNLQQMIRKLQEKPTAEDETQALIMYFEALQTALSSTNPQEHELLWANVDRIWMRVSGRMQPVHMMESYADFLGLRIEPEYVLSFRDDRFKEINDRMDQTKLHLISYLSREFENKMSLQISKSPMIASIVGVFTVMLSGAQLEFRRAGQNVPNREEMRFSHGVKIFIDMKTMGLRWEVHKSRLLRLLGPEILQKQFSDEKEIIILTASVFIAGHEVGHNAFIQDSTRQKLGSDVYKDIEENKADLCAICAASVYLTDEEKQSLLKGLLGSSVQTLMNKAVLSKKPYYYSSIVILSAMRQSGILSEINGKWVYDDAKENIDTFSITMRHMLNEIVAVYDQQNPILAKQYMETYYRETDFLQKIEEKIGANDT